MNGYARLNRIKADIAGVTSTTTLDAPLVRMSESVSRELDRKTGRHFYHTSETIYLDGNGQRRLYIGRDLLSITTLKISATLNQPTTFDYTMVSATDYTLWPRNAAGRGLPYRAIELNPNGQFETFPEGVGNVEIVAVFGYSQETEDTTLNLNGAINASVTSVVCSATAASLIYPGDTIVVESEQMEVTAVSTTTLTVVRGINGSTAAAHDSGDDVFVRRYPRDVEEAVTERIVGLRWDSQGGYDGGITLTGDMIGAAGTTQVRGQYARWRSVIGDYTDPGGYV